MASPVAVSVVMAAHNSARTIRDAINSVLLQSLAEWELIVVDDGSGDETVAVVRAIDDDRIRVIRQENLGPSAARNTGIHAARAPYVSTLDSDDLWLPYYLTTMLQALREHPEAALAYTDAWVLDDRTRRVRRTTEMTYQHAPDPPPADAHAFFAELIRRNFVYNSVTARRQELLAVGGYDERLWCSEDWELWLRLAASGRRCIRAPGILAVHRDHVGTLSSDLTRMSASKLAVWEMIERDWQAPEDIRALAQAARRDYERPRLRDVLPRPLLFPLRLVREEIQRRVLWHRRTPFDVAELLAAIERRSRPKHLMLRDAGNE